MLSDPFETPKKPKKSIDLTSMIDVIFILLIFFMVSTTFSKLGISIQQAESTQAEKLDPVSVLIGITKAGEFVFEKEFLSPDTLAQLVTSKLKVHDQKVVFILQPDKETPTQYLIDGIDICKESGATQFSIATKKALEHR